MTRNFWKLLRKRWQGWKLVCVSLDTDPSKVPHFMRTGSPSHTQSMFNIKIVDATKNDVCAYKLDPAFYMAEGSNGLLILRETIDYIHNFASDIPVILDAKQAGSEAANFQYAKMAFDYLRADAITVCAYPGRKALRPFLEKKEKGVFVVCCTSDQGAEKIQSLSILDGRPIFEPISLYHYVAFQAAYRWNEEGNCALVFGASCLDQIVKVRETIRDMPIFIDDMPISTPSSGDKLVIQDQIKRIVEVGKNGEKGGIIVSPRDIIFASKGDDFAQDVCLKVKELNRLIISQYSKKKAGGNEIE